MMNVNVTKTENGISFVSDFAEAYVMASGEISVCARNASHRVFRGFGKIFASIEDAKANYKSAKMLGFLDFVEEEIA